ncbi:MAG: hypothetical protein HC840_25445 [Leptolyngbyaceae cyanobacterium RM2_2_4]|nr:hypothetical protein [Leptolyngbyaceae cyanobacterium RM2_2_4]
MIQQQRPKKTTIHFYGGYFNHVKTEAIEVRWMEWRDAEEKWREYECMKALEGKTNIIEMLFIKSAYGFWL